MVSCAIYSILVTMEPFTNGNGTGPYSHSFFIGGTLFKMYRVNKRHPQIQSVNDQKQISESIANVECNGIPIVKEK